ncbi:hypothetical protein DERP_007779 [Dermatophagoides pteronyssinus]|uniref:Uncharacterized protein n=1 Tax=Dermatophagoides pteronyssinus TaxID=6956 RepID=A0ABQ8ISK6_DERPT|nr:hypothetical protein DERP_007779 [Dermatophagoides pteronyssinus]
MKNKNEPTILSMTFDQLTFNSVVYPEIIIILTLTMKLNGIQSKQMAKLMIIICTFQNLDRSVQSIIMSSTSSSSTTSSSYLSNIIQNKKINYHLNSNNYSTGVVIDNGGETLSDNGSVSFH